MYNIEDNFDEDNFDQIDVDNFTSDDFETYDDFAHDAAVIHTSLAPVRRSMGMKRLAEVNTFLSKLDRVSENSGTPKEQVLINMLKEDPKLVERVCIYLEGEGYTPADNFDDLAGQAAYARMTQIAEMQDEYCLDNFDEADYIFGKKNKAARQQRRAQRAEAKTKRQAARQQKKQVKQDTKVKRKLRRGELVDAKFNRKIAEEQQEQDAAEMMPQLDYPSENTSFEMDNEEVMNLANPTPEMAHAEIVGEELEEDNFDGSYDTFLPFLAGALEVGGQLVTGAKKQGADFTNPKTLFSRKKAAAGSKTNLGTQLPSALNAGIKEVINTVKAREKENFLKENMIWIVLGIVVIFFAGRMIK
jgi:hypothetical protein